MKKTRFRAEVVADSKISARVTPKELNSVRKKAKKAKLSIADLIRSRLEI